MPDVYESTVVSAPAEAVWETIRAFDGMHEWYPGIESDAIRIDNDKSGDAVGAIRSIEMPGDVTIREKLVEHSDLRRSYTYTIVDYPLPVEDYHGTLRVREVTDDDAAFVSWTARFEIDPELREDTLENITAVFRGGLDALRERFD